MKYSDEQRINKIYDYASKLSKYINDQNIKKKIIVDVVFDEIPILLEKIKVIRTREV